MSYATMDHAEWMGHHLTAELRRAQESGKRLPDAPEVLSEFQKRVVDIIGMIGSGIYNAPIANRIDWNYGGRGVAFIWKRELSTWDFNQLTLLVFLCHAARIRCQLESAGPKMIRIAFWQREEAGDMAIRHPNLAEAIEIFEEYLPKDHRVRFENFEMAQGNRLSDLKEKSGPAEASEKRQ